MIVVGDASTFVSAAPKAGSLPERALLRAVTEPNHLILSQDVESEYREVIFRSKFNRFVSVERRNLTAAGRVEAVEQIQECSDPKDDKYLALAAAGGADDIVNIDMRYLLSMHPWRGVSVLSPADYLGVP